jgi:lactate dehydrogenase-like 2-hydroxyacid dehydrogenase
MSQPKILITRQIPEAGVALLRPHCDVAQWEPDQPMPREELLRQAAGVAGLYSLLTDRVDAELLDAAPALKVVSNMAVGFDNVDVAECTRRGLPVGNTPGVLTDTTADLAFALVCAAARRVVEGAQFVREGRWTTWSPMLMLGQDVHGATLGLVGLGRIGLAVARRARGFNMRLLYADPDRHEAAERELGIEHRDLEALLAEADFVSLHTPLNAETRGLIDERRLRLMKPTAILVNTSRGPVVQTEALVAVLRAGAIGGAALDVTDPEPLPADHPLLSLPNCLVVPHIASASVATRNKMATMAAENLLAGLRGERLPNCVNPEVYSE